MDIKKREKLIVRTSFVGIASNIFLAILKASIGLLTNSLALRLDALNNVSDALSSVIAILGTKLASKSPDKEHPWGHGRIEYISTLVVAMLIVYAGISSLIESIKKIFSPMESRYNILSLWMIAVAIFVKLFLGKYVQSQGKKAKSEVLIASGKDAFFDALLSASILLSALFFLKTRISLEAYVGIFISIVITKSGIEMLKDPFHVIIGSAPDKDLRTKIQQILLEEKEVRGAYDLMIHNYGPNKHYASVCLELRDSMLVSEVDELSRGLEAKVYKETGVILLGIGVYSYNSVGGEEANIRNEILEKVLEYDWALQLHGFSINIAEKKIRFDVVLSFDITQEEGLAILQERLEGDYPGYAFEIRADVDI